MTKPADDKLGHAKREIKALAGQLAEAKKANVDCVAWELACKADLDLALARVSELEAGAVLPKSLIEALEIQCTHGNWNFDPYMHGMANGMIFSVSCFDNNEPKYLSAPCTWVADYKKDQPK
jgi:hypothetical protein